MLGDVGGGVLKIDAGEDEVGSVGHRHQRCAHVLPTLQQRPRDFGARGDQFAQLPGVAKETRPEVTVGVQDGPRRGPEGDRLRPGGHREFH